jgi:hypothetical protein
MVFNSTAILQEFASRGVRRYSTSSSFMERSVPTDVYASKTFGADHFAMRAVDDLAELEKEGEKKGRPASRRG